MTIDFMSEAEAMRDELIARRRDFHQHPELGFEEVRTSGIVAQELNSLGLEVQTGVAKTGVVGILEGAGDGPTILYRADMDALPIHEENETDYVSNESGKMHACGHDGHTTIGLGIAKLLSQHRSKLNGRVKFVFQPAEEGGGGARTMIDEGVLTSPKPDISLGIHLWNDLEVGTVSIVSGPTMSGGSMFEVIVNGRGGHGATPHQTADPIVCAAQIIVALQTAISRNLNPLDTAVLSIGMIEGGTALNVIPQAVKFAGSYRFFREETHEMLAQRIREIAEGVATAMGCSADVITQFGIDPVINAADVAQHAEATFSKFEDRVSVIHRPWMASEDVGLLMKANPGAYLLVGSANNERGLNYPHHHPKFDFDEDVLPLSVGLMSAAIADYLVTGD